MSSVLERPRYGDERRGPGLLVEAAPHHVRPGRRFEPTHETALDGPLRELASRLPAADQGVIVIPEFSGPNGVADLVAVTRSTDALEARSRLAVPFLTGLADANVAAAVGTGRITTPAAVARRLQTSEAQVRTRLSRLCSSGAIRAVGRGFVRVPELQPIGRMYALEAKVSDWRAALHQAVRYAGWADAAGLVLLSPPAHPDDAVRAARSLGIGLAVRSTWLVRPTIRDARSATARGARLLASERFAASLVRDGSYQSASAEA